MASGDLPSPGDEDNDHNMRSRTRPFTTTVGCRRAIRLTITTFLDMGIVAVVSTELTENREQARKSYREKRYRGQ